MNSKINLIVIGVNVAVIGDNIYNFMFRGAGVTNLYLCAIPITAISFLLWMDRRIGQTNDILDKLKTSLGDAPTCPSCGSTKTRYLIPSLKDYYSCDDCSGYTYSWFRFTKGRVIEKLEKME